MQTEVIPTPPSQGKPRSLSSPRIVMLTTRKRTQGKKEREVEEHRERLREEMPDLSKSQTAAYRHSYKHNLCLDMLQDGFHQSFAELFALIKQQNDEREAAGPESAIWNQTLLENEPEKLDMLKESLTAAETALREGNFPTVYKCQFGLARYFQHHGDKWLSDHFYKQCLITSLKVEGDEGRHAAYGHSNVGQALEENGDNIQAAENFEQFYKLSKDHVEWVTDDGVKLHVEACIHLSRIYTKLAEEEEKLGNLEQYQALLDKAYQMAREGGDKCTEGEASLRLGCAYEKNGHSEEALTYLNKYLDICRALEDNVGIGKACEAIAKSYESQGKVEESIKYLEMFVEVTERGKDDKSLSRACSDLGAIFNSLGRYEQAVTYFNKAYNISRALNDSESISRSRVQFGVAAAHRMLSQYAVHVVTASKNAMERLSEWKDNRGDEFDKPLKEDSSSGEEDAGDN